MVELISSKARTGICVFLKLSMSEFQNMSDDDCQILLNQYYRIANNADYRAVIRKIYMEHVTNDVANLENIQVYVDEFINLLSDNPNFSDNSKGGGTPKIINDLLMDGFSPPLFRQMVRDLGTTDISSTIDQLDGVYIELEIFNAGIRRSKI